MPLAVGSSPATVSKNVKTEIAAGKKQSQAVAIALDKQAEDDGPLERIDGVDLFDAREHRGVPYTTEELDQMVGNFEKYQSGARPLMRVPAVLGHSEDQAYLKKEGLPAAAWLSKAWRVGNMLKGSFEDVPAKVARLLRQKSYRTVSVEIYDSPPEGIPGEGMMIRRVAFLGGDIPEAKGMNELPLPTRYSEVDRWPSTVKFRHSLDCRPGTFVCFSEVVRMDRKQLLHEIAAAGGDAAKLESTPDEALAEIVRTFSEVRKMALPTAQNQAMWAKVDDAGERATTKDGKSAYHPSSMKGKWAEKFGDAGPSREDMINHLAESGMKPEMAAEMPDKHLAGVCQMMDGGEERKRDFDESPEPDTSSMSEDDKKDVAKNYRAYAAKFAAEGNEVSALTPSPEMPKKEEEPPPMTPPETGPKKTTVTHQYSEQSIIDAVVARLEKKLGSKIDKLDKFAEDRMAAETRARIDGELKAALNRGAVLPNQVDAGMYGYLYRLPATGIVKFSENGKTVSGSPLDEALAALKAAPVIMKYGEKVKAGGQDRNGEAAEEAEAVKVEQHFHKFSEDFPKTETAKGLAEGFKAARKHDPKLTAERFLGVA